MEKQLITRWFLGSNSVRGFCSLYDGYCRGEGDFLRVIKGGPGCGKSSFMRRIGEAASGKGLDVEYIHCSGDPDSLDGVYIPALRLGYADGTSPHIMDPACFGATGDYLNLGAFCDCARSRGAAAQLEGLTAAYKAHYARAYSLLAAAGAAATGPAGAYLAAGDREAAARRARSMAGRELPRAAKGAERGRAARRFLGGVTCKGRVFCTETLPALCARVYRLEGRFGLAPAFMEAMAEEALSRGLDVLLCPHPLLPDTLEAMAIPALGLGFVADLGDGTALPETCRCLHLDRLSAAAEDRAARRALKAEARMTGGLCEMAVLSLAAAKALHDELEAVYRPFVDFTGLTDAGEPRDSAARSRLKRAAPRRPARGAGKLPLINAPGLWYAGV